MPDLINVFISHKTEDKEIAELLHWKLELLGQGKVNCFISEKIPSGKKWFDEIKKNLNKADILILIFTSTHHSLDWPLYEVGLATNLEKDDTCKIICIHSPNIEPPAPIKYIQAVKGDKEGITNFLYNFFCTDEICKLESPINDKLRDTSEFGEISSKLEGYFKGFKPSSNYFTYCFIISIDSFPIDKEEVPLDAIISPKSTAFNLFRMTKQPMGKEYWVWGDLMEKIKEEKNKKWVADLGERFYWASKGGILKTMTSTLNCMTTGQTYRPILHKTDIKSNGSIQFEIIFMVHNVNT